MDENGLITIHFTDGTEMRFEYLIDDIDLVSLGNLLEKSIESNKLIMEGEGTVYVFPYANIKYIQVSPTSGMLPVITVRNVRLVDKQD